MGFPTGSAVKNLPAYAGVMGLIPGWGRSPGEGMATHSSILAWEIPWTEELGGPLSMGSQRVGHDLVTKQTLTVYRGCSQFPSGSMEIRLPSKLN